VTFAVAVLACSNHRWRHLTLWACQEESICTSSDDTWESQLRAAFWYGDAGTSLLYVQCFCFDYTVQS